MGFYESFRAILDAHPAGAAACGTNDQGQEQKRVSRGAAGGRCPRPASNIILPSPRTGTRS